MIDQSNIHCKPLFQHFIKICIREVIIKDQVDHIFKLWEESWKYDL